MKVLRKKTKTLKVRKSNKNTLPPQKYPVECVIRSQEKHNIRIYIQRDIDTAEPFIHIEPLNPKEPMKFSYKALEDFIQKIDLIQNHCIVKGFYDEESTQWVLSFHIRKKKGGQEMRVVYSFDRRKLIDEDNNVLALIEKVGLLYLSPLCVDSIEDVKQFIKEYKPIGFYNTQSIRIYKQYIESPK